MDTFPFNFKTGLIETSKYRCSSCWWSRSDTSTLLRF